MNQRAIGVFDSGMGGLTVLSAMKRALPDESFIYLGDTARLPYGTKSPETVKHYAMQMARLLVEREIKALVVACNTATTAALPHLKAMLPDIPVLGVVEPGAMAAASATRSGKVLVLATETTVASGAYQREIVRFNPNAKVHAHAASLLVALAEEGLTHHEVTYAALRHYLDTMQDEDSILLGCTHFPVFSASLKALLPDNVVIVDSARATADALQNMLKEQQLQARVHQPAIHYLVTDSVARFQRVGEIFLQSPIAKADIELIDAC